MVVVVAAVAVREVARVVVDNGATVAAESEVASLSYCYR